MADGNMTLRPDDSRLPDDGARRRPVEPLAGALLCGVCPGAVRALAVFAGLLLFADDGLPSTVAVPGPYPTIQAAIDGVPSVTVIQLATGTYHDRLTLQSITRALTLRGDATNPGAFVIAGGGAGDTVRILSCGTNVVFEGVTITGGARGNDGYGGGGCVADRLGVVPQCVFAGDRASL